MSISGSSFRSPAYVQVLVGISCLISTYGQPFFSRTVTSSFPVSPKDVRRVLDGMDKDCTGCAAHALVTGTDRVSRTFLESPVSFGDSGIFSPRLYIEMAAALAKSDLAEGIRVRSGTVLRLRHGAKLVRQVVNGDDPLRVQLESGEFDIVYVGHDYTMPVLFFLKTNIALTAVQSDKLIDHLNRTFSITKFKIVVRNNPWFQRWRVYPLVNPFEELPSEVPTLDQVYGPELVCVVDEQKRSCGFHGKESQ